MSNDKVNELASVHLGKAGDGSIVKPYVTPDNVDPTLLVAVPRYLNRVQYNIEDDHLPFVGCDAWNAYEFSTLLTNGFPVSGWLKFVYSSDTPNIVESKSVKLYLNSYNMARLIESCNDLYLIEEMVSEHLSMVTGGLVDVSIATGDVETGRPIKGDFIALETYCDIEKMNFNQYNESPEILKVIDDPSQRPYQWRSNNLRSNCRVTNQPDFGDVYIYIKGKKTVTPESLMQYIVSMRKENHFHEEIAECIYKRLWDILRPKDLLVVCLYSRRGGIDINPVRASCHYMLNMTPIIKDCFFSTKTSKQ
jgi:7-cyano-7-deazaguanine reductase